MARLLDVDEGLFKEIAFGKTSDRLRHFLDGQIEQQFSNLNRAGRQWLERTKERWEDIRSKNLSRNVRAAARKIMYGHGADVICELTNIGQFQQAKGLNRRYVMASPIIRNEFIKGRIEGYGKNYVDMEPGSIGEEHRDYRRVMDGIVQIPDVPDDQLETSEKAIYSDTYFEADDEYDFDIHEEVLAHEEQEDILFNWSFAEKSIQEGNDDFSSEWNGSL